MQETKIKKPHSLEAMIEAIRLTGRKNLKDLLVKSSSLSCLNLYENQSTIKGINGNAHFLFPTLNSQLILLFDQAIISSKAAEYKDEKFEYKDFVKISNLFNDVNYRDIIRDDEDDYSYGRSLFSRIGNTQGRLHEGELNLHERVGRFYLMYIKIPQDCKLELQEKFKTKYKDIQEQFLCDYGISIEEFLLFGLIVSTFYFKAYETLFTFPNDIRKKILELKTLDALNMQHSIIEQVINMVHDLDQHFIFRESTLVPLNAPSITVEKANAYLKIVSKTTKKLREIVDSSVVYTQGFHPDRLSPLERYPIIELENHSFIVPNIDYFIIGITELLHYIFQEDQCVNIYGQIRGYIQEQYIIKLIRETLDEVTIIPEITYSKQSQFSGPDVTVIENKTNRIIVIESKARRLRAITRVDPTDKNLHEDMKDAIMAFERLPEKIKDMYKGFKEYSIYQETINKTKDSQVLAVVLTGEGGFLQAEQFHHQITTISPESILNNYPYPYCIMDLRIFERALTIVSSDKSLSLYDILLDYAYDSQIDRLKQDSADSFRGRNVNYDYSPILKYSDAMFAKLEKILTSDK